MPVAASALVVGATSVADVLRDGGVAGRLSLGSRDDRDAQGHLCGDRDVGEHQVEERVGPGLVDGQRRVLGGVLVAEGRHGLPGRGRSPGGQLRPPVGGAVGTGRDLDAPVPLVPAGGGGDLVGGDAGRDPTGDGGDPGWVHPHEPVGQHGLDRGARLLVEPVADADDLVGVDAGQLTGHHLGEQPREPRGQRSGQADLAPGGPLADPRCQRHLGRGHLVDEPELVVHLDRPALGEPGLVRAGVRDGHQLCPLDGVGRALQLAGDLEQLVGAHLRRLRGEAQHRTRRPRHARPWRRLGAGCWTYFIILEHTYESKSYAHPIPLLLRIFGSVSWLAGGSPAGHGRS